MKNIPTPQLFSDSPCARCGSKKKVINMGTEIIESMSGMKSTIKISQIICTNKECQEKFDENRAKEIQQNNDRKLAKEKQEQARRESIARTISEKRKI